MNFNWDLYVHLAQDLVTCESRRRELQEAYLRTSISRSYYGIHITARKYVSKFVKLQENKKDIHNVVIRYLKSSNNPTEREVGSILRRLWDKRKDADYHDFIDVNEGDVISLNEQAFQAIGFLNELNKK